MSVYSWQKDSMTEGGLYRYTKKMHRMLFSDLAISDYSNRWEYGIAEIQHDNVVVFSKSILAETTNLMVDCHTR